MHYSRHCRRHSSSAKFISCLARYRMVLFVFVILFGIAYFWQVNSASTRGFAIRQLDQQVNELKRASQKLELDAASAESSAQINERIKQLNMVVADNVEYMNPATGGVAMR